jgi:glycosyltransferase involved in cell wall biosynthesis
MKIVFATHAYAPAIGGAERYAQGIAEALVSIGHEVHVLTPDRYSAEAFYEYGHPKAGPGDQRVNGVHVHRISLDPGRSWRLGRRRTTRAMPVAHAQTMWKRYATALAREIKRLAPDATVALPHAFPNVLASLQAPGRGVAVYAPLLHEEDPAWRIEPIAELVARSDVVLAMTSWERERLIEAYGAEPDRTHVVPPSVDAPDQDSVLAVNSETPHVVSIGRRTVSKELLTTARAVNNLNSEGTHIRFIIAGPGDDPDLDRELRSFGSFIEIIGTIPEREKWGLIKGAVASVSMSAAESFGIGIVESWAMHTPAIARRVPSIAATVEDGVDGLLVDNEHDLAAAIRTLLADPDEALRMGAAGEPKIMRSTESAAATLMSAINSSRDRFDG